MRRVAGYAVVAMAATAAVIGVAGIKWYAWDIVISEAGAPDRSMLFWGLPILFLSMAAIGITIGLALLAGRLFREPKR
jgi:hypothetical protein